MLGLATRPTGSVAAVIAALAAMLLTGQVASAYDGTAAQAYADQYAINPNYANYPVYSNDCQNFVSQSVNHGGYSYTSQWSYSSLYGPSYDWYNVQGYYNFLMSTYPGGWDWGHTSGAYLPASTDGLWVGDVVMYDWDSNGTADHSALQISYGYDATAGVYGDRVDEHTSNRQGAIWHLWYYNSSAPTTTIWLVHIDPANN